MGTVTNLDSYRQARATPGVTTATGLRKLVRDLFGWFHACARTNTRTTTLSRLPPGTCCPWCGARDPGAPDDAA